MFVTAGIGSVSHGSHEHYFTTYTRLYIATVKISVPCVSCPEH